MNIHALLIIRVIVYTCNCDTPVSLLPLPFQTTLLDTNPYLLGLTVAVSILHSVFDFLAFKNGKIFSLRTYEYKSSVETFAPLCNPGDIHYLWHAVSSLILLTMCISFNYSVTLPITLIERPQI